MEENGGRRGAEGGNGGKWRGKSGGIGGKKGLLSPTERTHAPFRFGRRPQATPGGLGSARVRRLLFRPKPALNEILGARLGRFSGAGAKSARLEML